MSEKPKAETEPTEKKSNSSLIIIILLTLILLGGAGAAYFFFTKPAAPAAAAHTGEAAPEAEAEAEEKHEEGAPPVFIDMEPYTVNLQPEGQFLQASFNLQVKDEKVAEEIKLYMPQIRSRLLLLLSAKTAEELSKQEGKTALITEMEEAIEKPFSKGAKPVKIDNVFITSFVIQ